MRLLLLIALLACPLLADAQGAHRDLIDKGDHPRALAKLEKDLTKDPADAAALYSMAYLLDLRTYGGRDVDRAYATVRQAAQAIASADAKALERWAKDGVDAGAVRDLRELIVANALQQTLQRNTMDACRTFLRTYAAEPASALDQARARLAQLAYVDARNSNTIAAYEQFLSEHPGAKEGADARERIAILAFDALAGSKASAPYRDYLARHPNGPRTAQARAERERWEFRENARPGDAQGYVDYIRSNPNSAALQEARDSLRAAGGPPEGYRFRRTSAPAGEHHYLDELRGLVLVNVGGKRYTDLGFPLYEDEYGEPARKPLSPPGIPLILENGRTYQGGLAGLDFGFSGQALMGDRDDRVELVVGGKWSLRKTDGSTVISGDHDDIYAVDDLFCACKGGTYRKEWDPDATIGSISDQLHTSKGECALYDLNGLLIYKYNDYIIAKNPNYEINGGFIDESIMTKNESDSLLYILIYKPIYKYTNSRDYIESTNEVEFELMIESKSSQILNINRNILSEDYDAIHEITNFLVYVQKAGKLGVLDLNLNVLIMPQFASIENIPLTHLYVVNKNENIYDLAPLSAAYLSWQGWNVYDANNRKYIFENDYSSIEVAYNSLIISIFKIEIDEIKYGIYTMKGEEIIPIIFDQIIAISDGLFAIAKDSKWGLTNTKGDKLLLLEHTFEEVERKAARFQ